MKISATRKIIIQSPLVSGTVVGVEYDSMVSNVQL